MKPTYLLELLVNVFRNADLLPETGLSRSVDLVDACQSSTGAQETLFI